MAGSYSLSASVDDEGAWSIAPTPTPEPAEWTLLLVGFVGVGAAVRARRRGAAAKPG